MDRKLTQVVVLVAVGVAAAAMLTLAILLIVRSAKPPAGGAPAPTAPTTRADDRPTPPTTPAPPWPEKVPPTRPTEPTPTPPPPTGRATTPEPSVHLTMGNPSGATDDPANADNYLMRKPYFALSYNNAKGTPNWVSWRLRKDDLGPAPRNQFYPDATLPRAFKHVTPKDYTNCGFDRGHMCPRSDRTSSAEAADATFVMTNILPQSPHSNQHAWADLEDYCRELAAKKGQTLYVVAGPQGVGGVGSNGPAASIAGGKVVVPAKCWKVVLALDGGTGTANDANRVGPGTRVIAVVVPNDQTVGEGWAKYRTSVKAVEALTGYRFFDRVAPAVIEPLKARVDAVHVPAPHPTKRKEN